MVVDVVVADIVFVVAAAALNRIIVPYRRVIMLTGHRTMPPRTVCLEQDA